MVSGRQTLHSIEQSIADLRRQERMLIGELEQANDSHLKLLAQRTAAFRELAEVRTKSAIADGVIDRADQLQHRVESVLIARQKTIDALQARDGEADRARNALVTSAEQIRVEIADLEERLDDAASEAKRQLLSDPEYAAFAEARDAAQATFDNADKKAKRAENDYREKGKAYEADPLFMYLWKRKYGVASYRPGPFVRMGDDFVARLVRYNEARANYAMLGEIPKRLRAHCDELEKRASSARAKTEAIEAERVRKIAGTDLIQLIADARMRQSKNHKELEAVEAEIQEVSRQLKIYSEGLDPMLKEAVELAAGFLEQENMQRLVLEARQTTEPTDDNIVSRIAEIDRKAGELKREIAERRRELDDAARRRTELMEVAQRFRRQRYDDPGSVFGPDDVVGDLLKELIRGAITGADYWQRSRRRHGWNDRPADPFRRGSGLPPFGGGGWGSGSGDDDFRTGGGF
ncbi:MAG: hypothetical protein RLZ98_480 [Pseudomonadota bacterium]|jgi:chromosome segregation ATPase